VQEGGFPRSRPARQKDIVARVLHKIVGKLQGLIMDGLSFHWLIAIRDSKLRKFGDIEMKIIPAFLVTPSSFSQSFNSEGSVFELINPDKCPSAGLTNF